MIIVSFEHFQAFVLKRYPVELLIMFFYSIVVAILSAISSFIIERDFNAWSLRPKERLFAVIYAVCKQKLPSTLSVYILLYRDSLI